MRYTAHQWPQRIKEEFGDNPKVIIASFFRDGYSKRLTAGAIGINRNTLIRFCKRAGIDSTKHNEMRLECKGHGKGWPKGKKRKL